MGNNRNLEFEIAAAAISSVDTCNRSSDLRRKELWELARKIQEEGYQNWSSSQKYQAMYPSTAGAAGLLPRRPAAPRVEPVARDLLARPAQPRAPRRRAALVDRRRVRARRARDARLRVPGRPLPGARGRRLRGLARRRDRINKRGRHDEFRRAAGRALRRY